ncbi:hypothetical protein STFR1_20789 [Bacillus vallismortis]
MVICYRFYQVSDSYIYALSESKSINVKTDRLQLHKRRNSHAIITF